MIADVLSLFALLVLAAFGVASGSVVVWALFQAAIKLWQLPGDRRRMRRSFDGNGAPVAPIERALLETEKLADWYSKGQLTWTELDLLAEFVVWQGRTLPPTAAQATAMLWDDFERRLAPPEPADAKPRVHVPLEGTAAVPDLPPHYFDGRLSADPPEDLTGWVEWTRPGKASIWIRRGS